jgi:hypothetical protein
VQYRDYEQRWDHLNEIMQAVYSGLRPERAQQLVDGRKYGKELIHSLSQRPMTVSMLAAHLGTSPESLITLINKFEIEQLVERVTEGRNTWVVLGLMGHEISKTMEIEGIIPEETIVKPVCETVDDIFRFNNERPFYETVDYFVSTFMDERRELYTDQEQQIKDAA